MMAAPYRRLVLWVPVVLALILVLAWLLRPDPVAVDLATVARGPMRVTVSDEGETRVQDIFVVSAPVPGLMRRIDLEAGDRVIANSTVIARIEPTDPAFLDARSQAEAQAAVRAAEAARAYAAADVARARAELEFAQSELTRFRGLAQSRVISASDLDSAERRARTAAAGFEEARALLKVQEFELQRARARLVTPGSRPREEDCACVTVRSPVSGRILHVLRKSEGVVDPGTPLVQVGDSQKLEIVVDLLSGDAVRVRPGQRVFIEGWGGAPLEGVVQRVEPSGFTKVSALGVEEQRVNVVIDFVSDPGGLGHGFRVEPRIVLWENADTLQVPMSALFRDGERWAVFVARDRRVQRRHVQLGEQNGLSAQVLGGLAEGERVVLHPSDRVTDGSRVREREV